MQRGLAAAMQNMPLHLIDTRLLLPIMLAKPAAELPEIVEAFKTLAGRRRHPHSDDLPLVAKTVAVKREASDLPRPR